MVIDTSAVVATLLGEPMAARLTAALNADALRLMSAATLVECALVLEGRHGAAGRQALDDFVADLAVEIVPLDAVQAELAREAFRRFGKGLHPAGLNYGDEFAYALAKARGEPLLFDGDDFARTDIASATT